MKMNNEIEAFIKDYVIDMAENNAAIFSGAGMSKAAGYVNWPELLRDIAKELSLDVDKEHDLISLAQYHVNERGGKAGIIKKILQEFSEQAEPTQNHEILSRLPINTYWTTNYDKLIESSLTKAFKIVDVKHSQTQLTWAKPKRDVVVYKMHGDVEHPENAILTKQQYEGYFKTHEPFITTLSSDLISKTFLFIGFSFTDPNLDYVLSRLNIQFGENNRQHYCFIKKYSKIDKEDEDLYKYNLRKQELMIGDLKRYRIKALLVDSYEDITSILKEIENRYKKRIVFISGSAEVYGSWDRNTAQVFIHSLSKAIISEGYRVVNGFGWGVGSAVINGALEAVYEKPDRRSEDQLIMKPFPQFKTGNKELKDLWEEYRQRMIPLAGVAIFIFGNKADEKGGVISANGVKREFEIALQHGLIPIPVAATGYVSEEIYQEILKDEKKHFAHLDTIAGIVKELASDKLKPEELIKKIITALQTINK
jgi:hypothetical protein